MCCCAGAGGGCCGRRCASGCRWRKPPPPRLAAPAVAPLCCARCLCLRRYRLLRLDHSVMGGQYVAPADVAGQSGTLGLFACLLAPKPSLPLLAAAYAAALRSPSLTPKPASPNTRPPAVYSAFHLQQAAVLLRPGGRRSLHIGLGAGTAVAGMQCLGVTAGAVCEACVAWHGVCLGRAARMHAEAAARPVVHCPSPRL